MKLQGHKTLYGNALTNGVPGTYCRGVEHIELWIVPPNFRPRKPNFLQRGWPLAVMEDYRAIEAVNPHFRLFAEYTDTPSWPTWGKDLYRALQVIPAGYSALLIP